MRHPPSVSRLTLKFVDWVPYLAFLIVVGMFCATIISALMARTVLTKNFQVEPDTVETIGAVDFTPQTIGATRITASAQLGSNQWVTYEIQLKDQQGTVIASFIKESWNEQGTWREEGESGSWQEEDSSQGVIELRALQAETVTIAVQVLDYTDASGKDIDLSVPMKLQIETGVVDLRYFSAGVFGTLALATLALLALTSGRELIYRSTSHRGDVSGKATLGGTTYLLRATVQVNADATAPQEVHARLMINDSVSHQLYNEELPLKLGKVKNDAGKVLSASGSLTCFFVLERRDYYEFRVEITPDSTIAHTALSVREGCRTTLPVFVTFLEPTTLEPTTG